MKGNHFSCLIFLQLLHIISAEMDTIGANEYIRDGETIISSGEIPGNSKNREIPLNNTSGVFKVSSQGSLLLLNGEGRDIWSSNSSVLFGNMHPVAQLQDNGNLIMRNESDIDHLSLIWQSFDHPCDHILPGMKFGQDLVSGRDIALSSWKSLDDPSPGLYVNWMDTNGYPQTFISHGVQEMPNPFYTYEFVVNQKEVYFKWELINSSFRSRAYLSPQGHQARLNWVDPIQAWIQYAAITVDMCAQYGQCGPNGTCDINKDGFQKITGVTLPDSRQRWYNVSMSLAECKKECNLKRNCSCTAYANLDVRNGGSGCLLWFGNLTDIRDFEENQDLYIRIAMTESTGSSKKRKIILVLLTSVGVVLVGLTLAVLLYGYKKKISPRAGNLVQSLQ
ncbi:hypothetical protein Lser_V15G08610 [Lactuca serriola]